MQGSSKVEAGRAYGCVNTEHSSRLRKSMTIHDDPQVYRMQLQRMTFMKVSSFPRVGIIDLVLYFSAC